ncbi:hypothetical protein VP03_15455 [Sinorhizobium meliloti]|nr:hypothetical protein VP03_15455 [Sinorhizobium meliloti]
MVQRREQGFIQERVSQPTIEALEEGVLERLARSDAVPIHLGSLTIIVGLPLLITGRAHGHTQARIMSQEVV